MTNGQKCSTQGGRDNCKINAWKILSNEIKMKHKELTQLIMKGLIYREREREKVRE